MGGRARECLYFNFLVIGGEKHNTWLNLPFIPAHLHTALKTTHVEEVPQQTHLMETDRLLLPLRMVLVKLVCYKLISKLIKNISQIILNATNISPIDSLKSSYMEKHLYTYKKRSMSLKALGSFLQNSFPAKE